jgi:hypothetical protein
MAVVKKPQPKEMKQTDIEALINKGGSHAVETAEIGKDPVAVLLKVPAAMLEQVDHAAKSRPVKIPRRTWILEAIHEKLSREAQP